MALRWHRLALGDLRGIHDYIATENPVAARQLVSHLREQAALLLQTGEILEAKQRINAIARDLVGHYVDNILPNGFKAQVVCHSKLACMR